MEWFYPATVSALLTGFIFANAVIEAIGLFTYQRIGFGLLFGRGSLGLLALPLLIMTGPAIVMRELVSVDLRGPVGWVFTIAGAAVVMGWSLASGHVLLRLIAAVHG